MKHQSNEIYDILKQAVDIIQSLPEVIQNASKALDLTDSQTNDILHEIELTDFDKKKSHAVIQEIKEIRQQRRIHKNDLRALQALKQFNEKNGTFCTRLDEALTTVKSEIDSREKRIYTPRVRHDKMDKIYSEKAPREESNSVILFETEEGA